MKTKTEAMLAKVIVVILLMVVAMGWGCSSGIESALEDIPPYPGAIEGESMAGSVPGNFMGGALKQFTTTDSFDQVVNFYADALYQFDTEFMNHESELGRQTAISIPQSNGMVTVAIQEFTEEGTVNITLMAVGG